MSEPGESAEPVEIPYAALSSEALRGVIEAFVLREGTDYGEREFTLAQKGAQVLAQDRPRCACVPQPTRRVPPGRSARHARSCA